MRRAFLLAAFLFAIPAFTHAQDVVVIQWEPVARPAQLVLVPRYGPVRRLLWGPYRIYVVPKVETEQKAVQSAP